MLVCDFKSISGADQARNPLCTPLFGGRAFCQFSCAENKTLSYIESNTALKNAWMCNKGDFSVKRLPDCVGESAQHYFYHHFNLLYIHYLLV